jgi:acyl-CoA synthetase (AMP-forming)/AMP-acid ligase II
MIATWKAGGIMVSVSPMLKHKELKTQLSDSGAAALITLESLWHGVAREVVPDTDVRTVITTSELDFLDELRRCFRAPSATGTTARSTSWRSSNATAEIPPRPRRSGQTTSRS